MTVVELAPRALAQLIDAVEHTPAQAWEQPSNCAGWSVRELIGHATGSAAKILELAEGDVERGVSEPADWVSDDPAGQLREFAARLDEVLPTVDLDAARKFHGREVLLHEALRFPVADLAIHAWDVDRSQGRLRELPDDLLTFIRDLTGSFPEEMLRRAGGFAPATTAPADATPTTKLMAFLGRSA